ncbi:MAG: patatin-like phospholipase family protein [Cohaesibacter sp.]|jgi:NTE family protein|nr:patatin-like phospholipase family protein [Cohaesibacter sp.]
MLAQVFDYLSGAAKNESDQPDQQSDQTQPCLPRPSIGLALGGGAAKGWSHIGVIHALQEAGIKPDIITGTSIGAVVGGCYAAGEMDKLEDFARSLTRRRLLGLLDVNFSGKSLINGTRLVRLLKRYLDDMNIEDLPMPFMAVATELATGHEIWLRRGHLVTAMQASYALPGIFNPVMVNGRHLVDGALVNPVPVSLARAMGARIVLAVNLSDDSFGRGAIIPHAYDTEEVIRPCDDEETAKAQAASLGGFKNMIFGSDQSPGISSVMFDAYTIIQDRISRSRLAGDPPDVMISPRVNKIGMFEFHRAEEAIEAGYAATQKVIDDFKEISDDIQA